MSRLLFSHLLLVMGVAVVAFAAVLPVAAVPLDRSKAAMEKSLQDEFRHFTGVAAAYRGINNLTFQQAFGNAFESSRHPQAMDMKNRFPIASNTKLYVAVALYQLQEANLVNLSRPIQHYLDASDFANFGKPKMTRYCPIVQNDTARKCQDITFVQLLEMSACMPSSFPHQFAPYPGSIGAVIGMYYLDVELLCVPGAAYLYSNPSFIIASYFIEKFSKMSLSDYFKKYITEPLGMHDTYYDPYGGEYQMDDMRVHEYMQYYVQDTANNVTTYRHIATGVCSSEFDIGVINGAGGLVATAQDQATFYYRLFNFTGLVPPTTSGATASSKGWSNPLFRDPSTLLAIVKARNLVPNTNGVTYYAQGVLINTLRPDKPIPVQIAYEGSLLCSVSANTFDLRYDPPLMTQVWTNQVKLVAPSVKLYEEAKNARVGSFFFSVYTVWPRVYQVMDMSWFLWRKFGV